MLSDIDIQVNPESGDVTHVDAQNKLVDRTATGIVANAEVASIVAKYRALAMPIANRVVGEITAAMPDSLINAAGETALGDVIADAQLQVTAPVGFGEAVVAFINPGGIRVPGFSFVSSPVGEGGGKVTYGEAFTVQPFGNSLVTLTLSGKQIHILLEQQFTGCNATNAPADWNYPAGDTTGQSFNRILQVSAGFAYEWSSLGAACDKVDPMSIRINGVVVNPLLNYRVTINNFLADGGDKFYVLSKGGQRLGGAQDVDALEVFFKNVLNDADPVAAGVQVAPGPQNRIVRLN